MTGKELALDIKTFLEAVQPLPIHYGYARGIKTAECLVTYYVSSSTYRQGIGNHLMSQRTTNIVTVQTKTAEQNILYSEMIKRGTEGSSIVFVSDSLRKDPTVKDGWINTIILYAYTSLALRRQTYTAEEVREELQRIADHYLFVTSIYNETLAQSIIDNFIIPELPKPLYSYEEFLQLKAQYLDRLVYNDTVF